MNLFHYCYIFKTISLFVYLKIYKNIKIIYSKNNNIFVKYILYNIHYYYTMYNIHMYLKTTKTTKQNYVK